jgi:ABC-type lipoprotein release transport system permease subunit
VYGVLASNVAQRARELGILIALGADARKPLTLVVGRGALLAAIGAVIGLASAAAVARLLRGLFDRFGGPVARIDRSAERVERIAPFRHMRRVSAYGR